ncbi:MAG: DoxX family protein [Verrucomicrobiota bacterium]
MKRILLDCGTRDATASLGLLSLRIMTGLMMLIGHGIPKIKNFDAILTKGFYQPDFFPLSLLPPQVNLGLTIGAEAVAATLIILGLLTRPAAFVFGFAMIVAAFGAHASAPWFSMGGPSKELAVLYLIPAIAIILSGAGSHSLDAVLSKDGKRRRW